MPAFGVSSYFPEDYLPENLFPEGTNILMLEPVFADFDKAANAGINTFAIQMGYKVGDDGSLSLFPGEKDFFASFIDEAHLRGFKIWLNPDLVYSRNADGPSSLRIIPDEIIENTDLIENFKNVIVETAVFAEEHGVEIFSPSSEMYVTIDFEKQGRNRSKSVIIDVKPRVDKVYSGKVCLRGEWPNPDFFDYYCFAPTVGVPRNDEDMTDLMNNIDFQLSREDMEVELIVGELWEGTSFWDGTPEEAKQCFARVLAAVSDKVNGVFILDAGRSYAPLFPGNFEDTIKEFYT